jgi:DNA-binding response OmpR family regulator
VGGDHVMALAKKRPRILFDPGVSPEQSRCGNVATILILDEQVDSCMLIKRVLEREGHKVLTSPNRDDGLQLAASLPLDLVILNTKPHCKNVATFVREMKRINPNLRMMSITNYMSDVLQQGVWDDFMLKPVDIDVLEIKVRALLANASDRQPTNLRS